MLTNDPSSKRPQPPAWALAGELGFVFCTPVIAAVLAGVYFDVGSVVMIVLVLAGVAVGAVAAYFRIAPYIN